MEHGPRPNHRPILTPGTNQDAKRQIAAAGRGSIRWLFEHAPLPPNVLLRLPRPTVDALMALPSGQQRVNQLFRVALGMRIGRGVIATVVRRDDFMKRVRENRGARSILKAEWIIILGQYEEHKRIARELGVPEPGAGESVAVKIVPGEGAGPGTASIAGSYWRVARDGDAVATAPDVPYTSADETPEQ